MTPFNNRHAEIVKTKEQLAEDKRVALNMRLKKLDIEGLGEDELRKKAGDMWDQIVRLESEKYDLEERRKRQDYDVSSSTSQNNKKQYANRASFDS